MLNETYRAMLGNKSIIRETFMYGKQRAARLLPQSGRPGLPHRCGGASGKDLRPAL